MIKVSFKAPCTLITHCWLHNESHGGRWLTAAAFIITDVVQIRLSSSERSLPRTWPGGSSSSPLLHQVYWLVWRWIRLTRCCSSLDVCPSSDAASCQWPCLLGFHASWLTEMNFSLMCLWDDIDGVQLWTDSCFKWKTDYNHTSCRTWSDRPAGVILDFIRLYWNHFKSKCRMLHIRTVFFSARNVLCCSH